MFMSDGQTSINPRLIFLNTSRADTGYGRSLPLLLLLLQLLLLLYQRLAAVFHSTFLLVYFLSPALPPYPHER